MKVVTQLLSASLLVLVLSCGGDKDSSPAAAGTSVIGTAVNNLNAQVGAVGNMLGDSNSLALTSEYQALATGLGTVWTTANGVASLSNTGDTTLKGWMDDQFNPDFENSNGARVTFAGRIRNTLMIFCYLGAMGLPTDADNLPTVGTHSNITLSAASQLECEGITGDEETGVTVTVAAAASTTLYDKYLEVSFPGGEACPFKIYARVSDTSTNISTAEDQTCEGRDHGSRSTILHDKVTKRTKFELISRAYSGFPTGFEMYRGYYDELADKAWVFGINSSEASLNTLDHYIAFTAAGKPADNSSTMALSAKILGYAIPDDVYKACVSDAGTVTTDNTLACTVTGTELDATVFGNIVTQERALYGNTAAITNISATTTTSFTDETNIFQ